MKIGVATVNAELRQVLETEIRASGHDPVVRDDLSRALAEGCHLVFAEWTAGERLSGLLAGLHLASGQAVSIPVVVLAPSGSAVAFSRAKGAGAVDVLFIPPDPEEIRAEIEDVGKSSGEDAAMISETFRELRRQKLVGEDKAFLHCLQDLRRAALGDANVLILGETGTGKEMFAEAIHLLSNRSGNKYLPINCASFSPSVLEDELFGHVKGAFTDAKKDRVGRFEDVGGGTLLLDEIGDIEMPLQTKLLRVIEQRKFQRMGENKDQGFHARLICATSVNLEEAVAANKFRPDLLGRINQFRIVLPPLRQRRTDISLLARHFLQKRANGRLVEFSKTTLEALEAYDFPMNVRQLENIVIEALMRSEPGRLILPKHLPAEVTTVNAEAQQTAYRSISFPAELTYKDARDYVIRTFDKLFFTELLSKNENNYTRVAEAVGIDRKTLRDRLKAYSDGQVDPLEE